MNFAYEFPLDEDLAYLNHAAVAPWPRRTAEAVTQFAAENIHLGAANYPQWMQVEQQLRERLKRLINAASTDDIGLAKNTSEALSVIAYGVPWQRGDNLIITDQEFPSNRIVWESLVGQGVEVRVAPLLDARTPETAIFNLVDSRTRLISVSSVQYASGLRMDCSLVGEVCKREQILFCIDAIQSLGALSFDLQTCHADFVVADGHKWMLGPEGLALFYSHPNARDQLTLRQFGWHMIKHRGDYDRTDWQPCDSAKRFECGSPNMLGTYALNASLSLIEEVGMPQVEQSLLENGDYLAQQLVQIPGIQLLSDQTAQRRSGIINFRHERIAPKELHPALLKRKVICAYRGGGIRFSPHFYTSRTQLDLALTQLKACIQEA